MTEVVERDRAALLTATQLENFIRLVKALGATVVHLTKCGDVLGVWLLFCGLAFNFNDLEMEGNETKPVHLWKCGQVACASSGDGVGGNVFNRGNAWRRCFKSYGRII